MDFDGIFNEIASALGENPWSEWATNMKMAHDALTAQGFEVWLVDDITVVVAENTLGIMRDMLLKGDND